MGLLSNRLGVQAFSLEDPAQPLVPPGVFEALAGNRSDAGIHVDEAQAMRLTTVYGCIKIITEDLGSTAHQIHQDMPDGSTRLATEHRLWPILHDQPNPNMTSVIFWAALLAGSLSAGNGYAWIKRDNAQRVTALVPLSPKKTSPIAAKGKLIYATTQTDDGSAAEIAPRDILHIPGLSFDGIVGISPVQACKNAFGLALAAERFGAQFFGNGARSTGVLSHPGVLDEEAYKRLQGSIETLITGQNSLRPIILEEGLKWDQTTIPPDDAQFLQTRGFQRAEIAGAIYRVALHLIGDLGRSTNNNIEHQSIDHVKYCLRPWAVRIEQEVNRKLLGNGFRMEHNLRDIQRGDFKSQAEGLQVLRHTGLYSANDGRRDLRLNPIPAEEGGDTRMVQGAMIPLTAMLDRDRDGVADAQEASGSEDPAFDRLAPAFRQVMKDAAGRVLNRTGRAGHVQSGEDAGFVQRAFRPAVTALAYAINACRYGLGELSPADLRRVDDVTAAIAEAAPAWDRKDTAAIAAKWTQEAYRRLCSF